jgi:annexin A7/11
MNNGMGVPMAGSGGQPVFLGVPVPHDPPSTAVGSMQGYNASFDAERVRKATKVCIADALYIESR